MNGLGLGICYNRDYFDDVYKIQHMKQRTPGDFFMGFSCSGSNITEICLEAGGQTVWRLKYDNVSSVPFTVPCNVVLPLWAIYNHDIVLLVKCEPNTILTVVNTYRNVSKKVHGEFYEELICSGPNDLTTQPHNLKVLGGMLGVGRFTDDALPNADYSNNQ